MIDDLRQLRDQLAAIERVDSVTSLLDVPLIESPPITLSEIAEEIVTLEHPRVERSLAQREFLNSPLYRNLLISPDGDTTALEVLFKRDDTWHRLLKARNLTTEEKSALFHAEAQFDDYSASLQKQLDHDIATVRTIMDQHRDSATLYLGGVPMIAADSINYVRHDLMTFGVGVFGFLVLILTLSLLVSGIRPVIDFGWMMVFGITIAMVLAFTFFPAALVLLKRERAVRENTITVAITRFLARSNERYGNWILLGFFILALLSVVGISRILGTQYLFLTKKCTG